MHLNASDSEVTDRSPVGLRRAPDGAHGAALMSKVPEVTALFWAIKVLTTGMGETTSDYLVHRFSPPLAVACGALAFAVVLAAQFRTRRYQPVAYWASVVMVSVFGTMAADVLHVGLGVPYLVSTALFVLALAVVFAAWFGCEGTLSIHSIVTPRREAFYWAAVLSTFALGTAVSDMTSLTLHLGWLSSGVLFTAAIAVPAVAHLRFKINPVLTFWTAYVLTRPLGASYADWLGLPASRHGEGFGTGPISLTLLALIVAAVGYLTTRARRQSPPLAAHGHARSTSTAAP